MEIWEVWSLLNKKDITYLNEVQDSWIIPYLLRLRGREKHLPYISKLNRMVFGCPPKFLHAQLFFSISPDPWVATPKATKFDEKKLDIVKPYLKNIYGWSENEFNSNKKRIIKLLNNKEFLNDLNNHVSFDKKEAKVLGIEYVKYKPKPRKERQGIDLSSF